MSRRKGVLVTMKWLKKWLAALLALALTALPAGAWETADQEAWEAVALSSLSDVEAHVGAALLIERETGGCIYAYNEHARLAPASVTKIMTLLLVMERIEAGLLALDQTVTCSAQAASMGGSQVYLEEGESMTVEELLKAVTVASGNDAAVALAEEIAGSEGAFVELMNRRAAELGMADTVFANCTGLPADSEHLTSAWDVGLMSRALLGHDLIRSYTTIWTDSLRDGAFGLANTNKLVRFYPGTTGLKTGFTPEAMHCLSASAMRDGVEFIAVILHGESSDARFESAKLLLNHAFAGYTVADALPDGALPPVAVTLGAKGYLQPELAGERRLLLEKSAAAGLRKELSLTERVEAPVAAGQELGSLRILSAAGEELAVIPVVAPEAVPRLDWGHMLLRYLRLLTVGR